MSRRDSAAELINRPSCVHYDLLEVGCLHRYDVRIDTRDGFTVNGAMTDIRMDANRDEFLVLRGHDREYLVRLSAVSRLQPLGEEASFGSIEFSEPD
ncbi:MAG: Rho-binding antiterminator [Pseudomonadota bacterium]